MLAMELAVALIGAESESKRCVGIGGERGDGGRSSLVGAGPGDGD